MDGWGALRGLNDGLTVRQIVAAPKLEKDLLALLVERKLIVELPISPDSLNYDRNLGHYLVFDSNPLAAIRRLHASQICILGVGGIGTVVLQHLVALGVRNYILVDNDSVEASNLNRQFIFSRKDIGRSKVEVCDEYIKSRVNNAEVTVYKKRVDSRQALEQLSLRSCDIIVHCLDTPRLTVDDLIYDYGQHNQIAVISAGVGVHYGHWGPLICPGDSPYGIWKAQFIERGYRAEHHDPKPTPWSFGPTNTLIAASLARDVAEWLAGRVQVDSRNTRLIQHFFSNQITPYGGTQHEFEA